MSTVDLEALQKGLVADRTNARYSDEELRQGHAVPPLPGEQTADAQAATAAPGQSAAPVQANASGPAATPGQAASTGQAAASSQAAAPVQGSTPGQGAPPAAGGARPGPVVKGAQAPPQESSLASPSVRSLPQGETPALPPPAPDGLRPQQQAALPRPAPVAPLPSALPIAPAAPGDQPVVMRAPHGRAPSMTLQAAEIAFAGDGTVLSAEDNQRLAEVAKLQKQGGGSLRIIGYARRGYGADAARDQLQSFGVALDRANAVAQALAKLGVPAGRITVQAAPEEAVGGLGAGQAEVLLDY